MPRSCRMQLVNYSDYCVLTDLDLRVSVDAGWHPSHLDEAGTRLTWTRLAPVSPGRVRRANQAVSHCLVSSQP